MGTPPHSDDDAFAALSRELARRTWFILSAFLVAIWVTSAGVKTAYFYHHWQEGLDSIPKKTFWQHLLSLGFNTLLSAFWGVYAFALARHFRKNRLEKTFLGLVGILCLTAPLQGMTRLSLASLAALWCSAILSLAALVIAIRFRRDRLSEEEMKRLVEKVDEEDAERERGAVDKA